MYELGVNLVRELRLTAGLTQGLLGKAAGTSGSTICAYERGRRSPTLRTLLRMVDAAGLEMQVSFVKANKTDVEDRPAGGSAARVSSAPSTTELAETSDTFGADYLVEVVRLR